MMATVAPTPDVLIIGAGPAGLGAAAALATRGVDVLVLEREADAGGVPRHSDHLGYGIRDLHRFLTGPDYARRLVDLAVGAGATVRTGAMVTGWTDAGAAEVTSPEGRLRISASATVLATGARERPRPARLVPGDRPQGVFTTGQLQNLVHLQHGVPGTRAVVVGAEAVSWSAVLTLRGAGCRTVLMATEHSSPESYAAFNLVGKRVIRTAVATRTRIVNVLGRSRLRAVEIENLDTGARRTVDCDTLVFTGDWIPDNELARAAGIELDAASKGPLVDAALRTSRDGVFAAGNLLHPVDTADIAVLDGRHVAAQVHAWLDGARPRRAAVRLAVRPPLRWVSPGLWRADDPAPARGRLLMWADELRRRPTVTVSQGAREISHRRLPWPASPGRVFRVPSAILDDVDPAGPPVTLSVS